MLDITFIRENADLLKTAAKNKHVETDIDQLLKVDDERRNLLQQVEELRAAQNKTAKSIPQATEDERAALIAEGKKLSEKLKSLEPTLRDIEETYDTLMRTVPSLPADDVPVGDDESDNVLDHEWGDKPSFDFEPKSHTELGQELDIIDFEHAANVAGGRAYYLKGDGARLQWAVMQAAIQHIAEKGFTVMDVPLLVREEAMIGTGYYPFGREDAYHIEKDDLHLIGTSEVPLASYHMGEIFSEDDLPRYYAGYSSCFRREAGSYGKDTKGLYRVHQFQKVEQVVICHPDRSPEEHMHILRNAEEFVQKLELPYRVMKLCTAELGAGQVKKYDIETWMPSRESYGETHSCSNMGAFQARRLGLRYKDADGKTQYLHTLNNTVIAAPRILIPLLEVHQRADGSIRIPDVLQPFMGGKKLIEKNS